MYNLDSERARLALEQAQLLVNHLRNDIEPNAAFVRTHALVLLQLVEDVCEDGIFIRR